MGQMLYPFFRTCVFSRNSISPLPCLLFEYSGGTASLTWVFLIKGVILIRTDLEEVMVRAQWATFSARQYTEGKKTFFPPTTSNFPDLQLGMCIRRNTRTAKGFFEFCCFFKTFFCLLGACHAWKMTGAQFVKLVRVIVI